MQAVLEVVEGEADGHGANYGLLMLWASLSNAVPVSVQSCMEVECVFVSAGVFFVFPLPLHLL